MPLRKPIDLPHLPNTRKKNIDVFKNTIPQPKPSKIEYNCLFYFDFDSINKKQILCLKIESIISFSSFSYEISTEIQKKGTNVDIAILGLTTQINNAPLETKATKIFCFDEQFGEMSFNIIKYDGCENSCKIKYNLYQKSIEIVETKISEKKNNRLFCNFKVAPELNNFSTDF